MNKKRQYSLIQYINRLPPELIRYTKPYLPISVLKTVRKIQKHELPVNYSLCKDLNDYFYKKYIGFDIDIKMSKLCISMLERKMKQNKCVTSNIFSSDFWQSPVTSNNVSFHTEIKEHENNIKIYTFLHHHYLEYYQQSIQQLDNYKILEI
jgi:hypothetical protein